MTAGKGLRRPSLAVIVTILNLSCGSWQGTPRTSESPSHDSLAPLSGGGPVSIQPASQLATQRSSSESTEHQVRNAQLTLSAFECGIVASNASESRRLFDIGMKAGRQFFAFATSNRDLFETSVKQRVPLEWWLFTNEDLSVKFTADFVLGRMFAGEVQEVNRVASAPDVAIINERRANIYRAKKCALIAND